ncbi:MAG: ribbon-helix-helix domain-containing protein [Patescibacteria group bacterium]|nr:ribbon-helix-helix domain-containing protein [Patescibacteria group bacterium]
MQTQLINFTIPKKLLGKIDILAKSEFRSRSELLREALRIYLASEDIRKRSFEIVRIAGKRNNLSEEKAIKLVDKIRDNLPLNK